jgi:hypothetical protein
MHYIKNKKRYCYKVGGKAQIKA